MNIDDSEFEREKAAFEKEVGDLLLTEKLKLVGQLQGQARDVKSHLTVIAAIRSARETAMKENRPDIAKRLDWHEANARSRVNYHKGVNARQ